MQRKYRLRRAADFEHLRREGRRFAHPLALLITCQQGSLDERQERGGVSRFAFSAGRHVGNAVKRNRAKRLLREAVRLQLDHIKPNWNCMFVARKGTPHASFSEVETAVSQLLERAKLVENLNQ